MSLPPAFPSPSIPPLLKIGSKITFLPIVNGSGQFAIETRRFMLEHAFDVLAVPLPPSFAAEVEAGVLELPEPSIVIARPLGYTPDDETEAASSYVPIDPCQSVIMAIRAAMGEHIPRAFIDLEVEDFLPLAQTMPDPFAVHTVSIDRFAAAVLPSLTRPPDQRTRWRMVHMAHRLVELEQQYESVLIVDSVLHWPWIRQAYNRMKGVEPACEVSGIAAEVTLPEHDEVAPPQRYAVDPRTLMFLMGELPFITALYERARVRLESDDAIPVDGVKELLLAARDAYRADLGIRGRRVTPLLLSKCLQYIRNLSLIHRRMTPDLYSIMVAAKQVFGDAFAFHVAENANHYAYATGGKHGADASEFADEDLEQVTMGIDQARLPDGTDLSLVNRLPGPPTTWRSIELRRHPALPDESEYRFSMNPWGQCSHLPEDDRIENFRASVMARAQAIMGDELARTEKFTTSVKDGIDIRDTLRHWYEKQIYVRVIPPSRGTLDACVMIFESNPDPREYRWRTTWFAENHNESTLAFFATDFRKRIVGPDIAMGIYGGAMFLYPSLSIPDVWGDRSLDFADTMEQRLIAAACKYSRHRHIALMSPLPPGSAWRSIARRMGKRLVHIPMSAFNDEQIQQMRIVHVLGGKHVRSYAEHFIRRV